MTKTLTEQWREGTLQEGLYYIEGNGNHDIALIRNRYCPVLTSPYCEDDVFESEFVPVSPVPSYEQFIGLMDDSKELDKAYDKIKRLQELLSQEEDRIRSLLERVGEADKIIKYYAEKHGKLKACDYLNKWCVK